MRSIENYYIDWSILRKPKVVVHCKDREQVDLFLQLAKMNKIYFSKKHDYVDCFNIVNRTSALKKFYRTGHTRNTWTIIELDDILEYHEDDKFNKLREFIELKELKVETAINIIAHYLRDLDNNFWK